MDIESYNRYINAEQLTKIATYGRVMIKEIKKSGKKVDKVSAKIDKTRKELGEKIDRVGEKIEEFKTDLRTYLDLRFKEIEEEIARIKAKIGMS